MTPHRHLTPCLSLSLVILIAGSVPGCAHPNVVTLNRFLAAKNRGDLDTARAMMSDNPRLWFEEREGEGIPWTLGGGRWKNWDDHFHSEHRYPRWDAIDDYTVAGVVREINDYYRLTERGWSQWLGVFYFDDDGKIDGFLINGFPSGRPSTSRIDEFEAWANTHAPGELEQLSPGGKIDPTGDHPQRFRVLLNRWRSDAGLPAIE